MEMMDIPGEADPMFAFFNENENGANWNAREKAFRRWAWAITSPAVSKIIAGFSPIVEVCAGTGWWASRIAAAGGDIIATDIPDFPDPEKYTGGPYHQILRMDAAEAAAAYSDRTLLIVWPPYESCAARRALWSYKGDTLIYIGENIGGCTADDIFHKTLKSEWVVTTTINIPQWEGIHDRMWVYRRRVKP